MRREEAKLAEQQMAERAAGEGLTFRPDGLVSGNTRDAHRLLQLAKVRGRQAELVERLHRAYFTDQRSIFDHSALADLAAEAGPDRNEAARVLVSVLYGVDVDAGEDSARNRGAAA